MLALVLMLALSLDLGPQPSQLAQAPPASLELLKRAADPNPTLHSYIASASLSAKLNGPLPLRKTFSGTVYYRKPVRKIIFSNVTGPLSKFKTMTSATPTFEQALAEYTITPLTDNGKVSEYSLTPQKQGSRVSSLRLRVDDASALIVRAVWSYNDGGSLSVDETYETVGAFNLPSVDTIAARFPGYSVDGQMRFSGYELNAPVPPSLVNPDTTE